MIQTNDGNEQKVLANPELIASVHALMECAERLNVVVAVAAVSDETHEISAFGMCCPQHLCDLLRHAADAVETVEEHKHDRPN